MDEYVWHNDKTEMNVCGTPNAIWNSGQYVGLCE